MSTITTALMLLILAQAPAQPVADAGVPAISPFVESDVFAILQLELARADLPGLATRVLGDSPPGMFADVKNWQWPEALRQAGAKEVYFLFSVNDMPGPPFVVVPLADGADAAAIGRLFEVGGPARRLVGFCTWVTVHNAVFAGSPAALERARRAPATPRPELSAAFAAARGEDTAARLVILPSSEYRCVVEEMVPNFPAELGGGPITDLTKGVLWAAAGLEAGPQPAFHLVAQSQDASAA